MSTVLGGVRRGVRGAARWLLGVMGDDAYTRYAEHARAQHPDRSPMGEREFWRERMDRFDPRSRGGCC